MKGLLSIRLAWSGIRKNRKLYLPYCLTIIGMVMMSYIMQALSYAPALHSFKGANQLEAILSLGKLVVAVFAAIFLLYTNSFLIRRRYREFGLYNVLGMDKNALCRVVFWENLMVAALGLTAGLFFGGALYKLAELGLVNMVHGQVDHSFTVEWSAIRFTLVIFAIIFAMLLLRSLVQVRRSKPLELLRSEAAGEKPPRANYLLGFLGVALLAGAYYMAVNVTSALAAYTWFFVAVLMVIAGTYLVMISGSVVLCRLLQKWKGYYYRKQHFVSVSSMAYRMKRNGAGLASICILATMVLVMISSTSSLYIGAEDSLKSRYPHDSGFEVDVRTPQQMDAAHGEEILNNFHKIYAEKQVNPTSEEYYFYAMITAAMTDEEAQPDRTEVDLTGGYGSLRQLMFLDQADYNRMYGTDVELQPGQALIDTYNCTYGWDTMKINGMEYQIVGKTFQHTVTGEMSVSVIPTITLVISNLQDLEPLTSLKYTLGNNQATRNMLSCKFYYGADFDLPEAQLVELHEAMADSIKTLPMAESGIGWTSECQIMQREDFYITFGGLFFIGIMLSIIFIAAASLIIYYKQVSEGYEDQARFSIMRKVGMTQRDIKKSVNSQILTVFFLPLLLAGVHLAFAFPMVWQLLTMFNLTNKRLVICTNIGAFLIFCVFYVVIYRFTAHAYYRIVSGKEGE